MSSMDTQISCRVAQMLTVIEKGSELIVAHSESLSKLHWGS
jgi:hypothetical protein